jgi:hypothetical protein
LYIFGVNNPFVHLLAISKLSQYSLSIQYTLEISAFWSKAINQCEYDLLSLLIEHLSHLLLSGQIFAWLLLGGLHWRLSLISIAFFIAKHFLLGRDLNLHELNQELGQGVMLQNLKKLIEDVSVSLDKDIVQHLHFDLIEESLNDLVEIAA